LKSYAWGVGWITQCKHWIFDHDNQDSFLDSEYTIKELNFVIQSLRVQSSPGWDGIDYLVIRNLPNEALEILLEIYNAILKAKVLPDY
jgi:hypothetical protein